ncbi:MAG: hypothetical protein AAGB51_11100 [Planctomycetota bacterium]
MAPLAHRVKRIEGVISFSQDLKRSSAHVIDPTRIKLHQLEWAYVPRLQVIGVMEFDGDR